MADRDPDPDLGPSVGADATSDHPPQGDPPLGGGALDDPVLVKRRRIAGYVDVGQKVGYSLFGLAIIAFVIGFIVGIQPWVVTLIVVCLVVGSLVLAPAIVFGHAVHAANRADREDGW